LARAGDFLVDTLALVKRVSDDIVHLPMTSNAVQLYTYSWPSHGDERCVGKFTLRVCRRHSIKHVTVEQPTPLNVSWSIHEELAEQIFKLFLI